jgi:tryptophan 2,3-dioxygenase
MQQRPEAARRYPGFERSPEEREAAIEKDLRDLRERYGERLPDVLEAALMAREITYDDYIQTPTLLSLQQTLTEYHDELIFKVYHQQTELWFRLILHEMERAIRSLIAKPSKLGVASESITRANRYFDVLAYSYSVMLEGLSTDEFMEFRKVFGTSSGFQSSQFRAIEILAGMEKRRTGSASPESRSASEQAETQVNGEEQAEYYWEKAARHITTNEPTLTLVKFKEQHLKYLNELYHKREPFSVRLAFLKVVEDMLGHFDSPEAMTDSLLNSGNTELIAFAEQLVHLDDAVVEWKQAHLKVAAKHLKRAPKGTGETNWAQYLTQSIREQRCFPELNALRLRISPSSLPLTSPSHG